MIKKTLAHPLVQIGALGFILLGVLVCVFPDLIPRFSWVVNHAVQLMLLYLLAGLVALFLRQPKLTFAFFAGCALLCFFLKYSVKGNGIERWRQQMLESYLASNGNQRPIISDLKIAHVNLTNANSRREIRTMLKPLDPDIISFHEVTPDWDEWLLDSLATDHSFCHTMVDLGIYGVAIYSKHELSGVDTFFYQEVPNLRAQIKKDGRTFHMISVHTQPALDEFSKKRLNDHLGVMSEEVRKTIGPILVVGDFNAVSWSGQVQSFMDKTGLMESRTGFMPNSFSGKISFWQVPLDHIFYSGEFICSGFQNITGVAGQHLGILGTYQFAIRNQNATKENQ